MTADLTREQAREQVARELAREFGGFLAHDPHNPQRFWNSTAAPILDVLWPVVEGLRAELAHAHTVIARHVEPLRKPCRPERGDCCDGDAHTWQPAQGSRLPDRVDGNTPSDALCGDLTGEGCGSGVSGQGGADGRA